MVNIAMQKALKEEYLRVSEEAYESGKLDRNKHDVGRVYTVEMLIALQEMAKNDVYPDGRFGDDECCVWSMFHR